MPLGLWNRRSDRYPQMRRQDHRPFLLAELVTRYAKGASRERQVRDLLRADGWVVFRCAASKPCDLIALRARGIHSTPHYCQSRLVEVKSDVKGPFDNFRPADRAELQETAAAAGAEAWLCWWPARAQPTWIAAKDWPA